LAKLPEERGNTGLFQLGARHVGGEHFVERGPERQLEQVKFGECRVD
jgi:hypothetical protein